MIQIKFFSIISLFSFILVTYYAKCQEPKVGIEPIVPLNSLSMDQWTGKDGLISNNLTSVNQSSDNFLWITTFNGFLRFDGVNFKLFDKNTISFLNSNGFYQSYEDGHGNLWFTSQSSGIVKFTDNQFQQILSDSSLSLSVRCIVEDEHGDLWIGTNNEGVFTLEDSVLIPVDHKELSLSNIMDIEIDDLGRIWFATNGNGIIILDGDQIEMISSDDGLNHNTVNKLLKGRDGRMYAGTLDGIYFYSNAESGRLSLLDGLEINDLFIDDFGTLWIGSEQGLYKLHLPSNIFDSFTEENGLPASQISKLCFDHENSLWLSTKKAGLIRLREGFFQNINIKDGLSSNNVNLIVEHDDKFYIGCDDGLINVYQNNVIERFAMNTPYYNVGVRDMDFENEEEILIASYRGLLKIDNGKENLIDLSKYGSSNDIRRTLRAQNGTIWIATRSSGVLKYGDENNTQLYNVENGLNADYILALEEADNGDIYIGTHSGGMSIIGRDGKVKNYPIEGGKSGILIFNIEILEDYSAWVATNVGLYKYDNERFEKVYLDENLKAETIFDVVIENDNVWLSSNIGLIKVLHTDLQSYLAGGELGVVPGRLFDRYDGMASQECTGATRMTLSKQGILWIPTLGGAAVLNPADVKVNTTKPNVFITDMITDLESRDLWKNETVKIEPGVLRYEFYFTSLSFIAPPKIRFKYKLKGIDSDWIDAGGKREAIYTNLPKGKYEFQVIATNNDGVWNYDGAKVKFSIQPYFYETIFFYVLVLIVVGLLIWGIIVWRIHNVTRINTQLRKLNEELDRFVYSASHDLRAPLSSVIGLVGVARLEKTIQGKDRCLTMINESINKLDGFINDIIDYSRNQRIDVKPEKINWEIEINEVFKELKFLDKDDAIEKTFNCEGSKEFMTDARRINIILKNLISNSFRYHDFKKSNKFIKVDVKNINHSAEIRINDNGIGIDHVHMDNIFKMFYRADEASKGSGLGLYIVKETVDKLNGKIEVESQVNEGTTFTIVLPSIEPKV